MKEKVNYTRSVIEIIQPCCAFQRYGLKKNAYGQKIIGLRQLILQKFLLKLYKIRGKGNLTRNGNDIFSGNGNQGRY